jgi:hypothetical protein
MGAPAVRSMDEIQADMSRWAATGEPIPGLHGCARCGSTEGVQAFLVPNDTYTGRHNQPKSMYDWERVDVMTAEEFRRVTVCACCSFDGCPHPSWDPTCGWCGRPIAAEGKWATRCPVDGLHGGEAVA